MKFDLEQMARIVRDSEQRFEQAKAVSAKVRRDVLEGERLEREIMDNIDSLKKDKIVVSAAEYKEALKNLNSTRHGLIRLRSYLLERDKDAVNSEKAFNKAKDDYQCAESQNSRTVLHGNFGRKNGQG